MGSPTLVWSAELTAPEHAVALHGWKTAVRTAYLAAAGLAILSAFI